MHNNFRIERDPDGSGDVVLGKKFQYVPYDDDETTPILRPSPDIGFLAVADVATVETLVRDVATTAMQTS